MKKHDDTSHTDHLLALDALGKAIERCGDDGAEPWEITGLGVAVRLLAVQLVPEPDTAGE